MAADTPAAPLRERIAARVVDGLAGMGVNRETIRAAVFDAFDDDEREQARVREEKRLAKLADPRKCGHCGYPGADHDNGEGSSVRCPVMSGPYGDRMYHLYEPKEKANG